MTFALRLIVGLIDGAMIITLAPLLWWLRQEPRPDDVTEIDVSDLLECEEEHNEYPE